MILKIESIQYTFFEEKEYVQSTCSQGNYLIFSSFKGININIVALSLLTLQ